MRNKTMRRRAWVAALWTLLATAAMGQGESGEVVILYENDVHCTVDGYAVLAGLRDSLARQGQAVAVVSAGDFLFGGPIGAASKGGYIARLMNAVGYDAATLGNHEFDYGMGRLRQIEAAVEAPLLCCNLRAAERPEGYEFLPYVVRRYGGVAVAFVGVTTPSTLYTSLPTAFQDAKGRYRYHFGAERLAPMVQQAVDAARAAGAEVVVLLSHIGDSEGAQTSVEVMQSVEGVDLVLDGHDHHVIASRLTADRGGREVPLSSTGTQFQYIGQATVSAPGADGRRRVRTRLVPVDSLRRAGCVSQAVDDTARALHALFDAMGGQTVGRSEQPLVAEENDVRVVRLRETNMGDLVADAFRTVMGADIGWANGGGIRANLPAGDFSHNDLLRVCPYGNRVVTIRTTGKALLDALETAMRAYPKAEGCFAQVSGIEFEVDARVKSGVVLDAQGRFERVEGAYRVRNVRVGGKPLDPDATYTIAGCDYALVNGGDAIRFADKEVVRSEGATDVEAVERYIREWLGGTVGKPYDTTQGRIVVRE